MSLNSRRMAATGTCAGAHRVPAGTTGSLQGPSPPVTASTASLQRQSPTGRPGPASSTRGDARRAVLRGVRSPSVLDSKHAICFLQCQSPLMRMRQASLQGRSPPITNADHILASAFPNARAPTRPRRIGGNGLRAAPRGVRSPPGSAPDRHFTLAMPIPTRAGAAGFLAMAIPTRQTHQNAAAGTSGRRFAPAAGMS